MARLRKGRFADDEILDYLQNKDNKALIFTNRHLIYISTKRQEVRWSFSLDNLSSVSTSGNFAYWHVSVGMYFCCAEFTMRLIKGKASCSSA